MKNHYVAPTMDIVVFEQTNLMADFSVGSNVFHPNGGGSAQDAM